MTKQIAWGIKSGDVLLPFTVRSTRKQAIEDFVNRHSGYEQSWEVLRAHGNSVVKVEIRELGATQREVK